MSANQQVQEEKLSIHNLSTQDPMAGFAEDVRRRLSTDQKRFLPKYFYDELGSQLFEAICLLPEYYLTRAENEILTLYADEIVAAVAGPVAVRAHQARVELLGELPGVDERPSVFMLAGRLRVPGLLLFLALGFLFFPNPDFSYLLPPFAPTLPLS